MIKVTMKKENGQSTIKWWLEGYENREVSDADINEVMDMIECSKKNILETMRRRQALEKEMEMSESKNSLTLIQVDKDV